MKLSIICLNYSTDTYNSAPVPNYHACLERIFASTITDSFEVILVDNGSPRKDQVAWLEDKWKGKVQFIHLPKNLGYHLGNEAGFAQAKGEYVMPINADAEVNPDTIQQLLTFMDTHTDVGIAGPQLIYPDGTIQDSYRRYMNFFDMGIKRIPILHSIPYFKKRMHHFLMWDADPNTSLEVDWIVGNCMLIRTSAYQEIGGYEHKYFLFMGDTDICRTMWKYGWKVIYFPDVKAIHQKSRLSGLQLRDAIFKKTFWIHICDYAKYILKWGFSSKRVVGTRKK